jgi:hypothetical protein
VLQTAEAMNSVCSKILQSGAPNTISYLTIYARETERGCCWVRVGSRARWFASWSTRVQSRIAGPRNQPWKTCGGHAQSSHNHRPDAPSHRYLIASANANLVHGCTSSAARISYPMRSSNKTLFCRYTAGQRGPIKERSPGIAYYDLLPPF